MAEIKGIFITMVGRLMGFYKDRLAVPDEKLFAALGKHYDELDPNEWVDINHYNNFLDAYADASPNGERCWVTLGRTIYPTLKKVNGFPRTIGSPMDLIDYEARGFIENLRGVEIKSRKFLRKKPGDVVVEMDGRNRNCLVSVGVFESLLEMAGVKGQVTQPKCVRKGDDTCEIHIKW